MARVIDCCIWLISLLRVRSSCGDPFRPGRDLGNSALTYDRLTLVHGRNILIDRTLSDQQLLCANCASGAS